MVKRNAGFLPNMYFIQKIAELALKVTFWQRINLTNFTLRLEIQKIKKWLQSRVEQRGNFTLWQ